MAAATQIDLDRILDQLDPEPDRPYQSAVLAPLAWCILVLSGLGGVAAIIIGSTPISLSIIAVSIAVNVLVLWLNHRGMVRPASIIFCALVNIGVLTLTYLNAVNSLTLGYVLFSAQLSMCVLLGGVLLGGRSAFGFAGLNSVAVVITGILHEQSAQAETRAPDFAAASITVPLIFFFIIVATISWLYQGSLERSGRQLRAARERIVRDEVMRRDVAIARDLQQRLLPAPPPGDRLSFAMLSSPARETSGDFYDFIELDGDCLGIISADATGKSLPAAMVMTMARSVLRTEARRQTAPGAVLAGANLTLSEDRSVRQILTALYAVIDPWSLQMRLANAGHPFPILLRGGAVSELEACGMPLGTRLQPPYEELEVQLEAGDMLVFFSDGLVEQHNRQREMFGFERLLTVVAESRARAPQQLVETIAAAVAGFRGGVEQEDDMTIVVLRIDSPPAQRPSEWPPR